MKTSRRSFLAALVALPACKPTAEAATKPWLNPADIERAKNKAVRSSASAPELVFHSEQGPLLLYVGPAAYTLIQRQACVDVKVGPKTWEVRGFTR